MLLYPISVRWWFGTKSDKSYSFLGATWKSQSLGSCLVILFIALFIIS